MRVSVSNSLDAGPMVATILVALLCIITLHELQRWLHAPSARSLSFAAN
jgi:hypothetical protein